MELTNSIAGLLSLGVLFILGVMFALTAIVRFIQKVMGVLIGIVAFSVVVILIIIILNIIF